MKTQPLNIVGGFYDDETQPFSSQDTVNWLPVMAEVDGTRTPTMLKTPPGLRPFAEPTDSHPTRGAWNCEGKYFTVIGNKLYQLSNGGVFIEIGTVPGVAQVSMSHNQQSNGQQLQIVNGSAGYIYNTFTQVFQRITDPGFPGSLISLFIGGYFVGIDPRGRFAFTSAAANGLEYNTLDRFTSEYKPDKLVTGLAIGGELLLLSETSGEFFGVTSNPQQPMRTKQIYMDKGCAGTFTANVMDNTGYWLGDDGVFYKLNGYSPVRISTQPIEQSLRSLLKTNPNAWRQARCFVWEDSGHSVCYWTFPTGHTWGYDAATGIWHRRDSLGMDIWRVQTMTFWNSQWYAGDFQSGKVWVMDWNYMLEGEEEFISRRTTQILHDNQCRVVVNRLELLMQVGQEETDPIDFPAQPEGPTVTLSLPDGNVGESWAGGTAVAIDGTPPYVFTTRPGTSYPGNLGPMSLAGVISPEVPTAVGDGTVIVRATDSNGLYDETTATFQIAMLLPWIISANFTELKDVKPSPDGIDWSDAGIDGPPASSYYRDDTEFLSVASSVDCVWISTDPLAGTWTSLGIDLEAGVVGPSRAAKAGDNWFIASTVPNARKYDGVTTTTLSWAAWTMAVIKGTTDTLFTVNSVSGGDVVLRDEDGVQTGTATFRASGTGVTLCTVGDRVAILHNNAAGDPQLKSIDVAGNILAHTCPFSGPSGSLNFVICYSSVLELIVMIRGAEVAYGPDLDNMTLAAHVLSNTARGIAEDGTRITTVGDGAMCETTLDGINWTPLSVSSTDPATVIDAIIAISNVEDP